jgi:hypothetical protein
MSAKEVSSGEGQRNLLTHWLRAEEENKQPAHLWDVEMSFSFK